MTSIYRLYLLKLLNYRNYSQVEFEFSQDPDKPITVFHGSMSAGKTSIMNAIHWCLYGEEPHFINEGEGKPIIRQKALNETPIDKSVSAEVELTFANEDGPLFSVSKILTATRKTDQRTKVFKSLANGLIDSGFEIELEKYFKYLDKQTGGWETIIDPDRVDYQIQRYFPGDLSNFIFFNGEMLDKFFSSLQSKNIKNGIERVSGLGIVDDAINHLREVEGQYRNKASDSSEATKFNNKIQLIAERLQEIKPKLEEYQDEKRRAQEKETKLMEVMSSHPEAAIREQEKNLEETKKVKELTKKLIEENREKQRNFIIQYFAKLMLLKPIKSCLQVLEEAETKGLTPPPIESHYLEERLSKGICICERELHEGSDEWRVIKALLSRLLDSDVASEATLGRSLLGDVIRETSDKKILVEQLNGYRRQRDEYTEEIQKAEGRHDVILKSLQEYGVEKVRQIGVELNEIKTTISNLDWKISPLVADEERLEKSSDDYGVMLDRENAKSAKAKKWKARQDLAKTLREALIELRESTLAEIRKRVEDQTNTIFSRLISRRWQLDKVMISPDYKIRVMDKEGVDNLKTLSAGQTLYLSFSFISALRHVTAINYPMVIDSPFGKVSGEERMWAAEDLPTFLPNTQITFLVTDTEYSSDVSNMLTNKKIPSIREVLLRNNKVWKEFNLVISKEDEVSSKTEVIEIVKS